MSATFGIQVAFMSEAVLFLERNWGNLASVGGVAFAILAWTAASSARRLGKQILDRVEHIDTIKLLAQAREVMASCVTLHRKGEWNSLPELHDRFCEKLNEAIYLIEETSYDRLRNDLKAVRRFSRDVCKTIEAHLRTQNTAGPARKNKNLDLLKVQLDKLDEAIQTIRLGSIAKEFTNE